MARTPATQVPPADQPDSGEQLWQALQYVLGELDEHDSEQFEARLLQDSGLCDMVVTATRLVAGLSVSCDEFHQQHAQSAARQRSQPVAVHTTASQNISVVSGPWTECTGRRVRPPGRAAAFAVFAALAACILLLMVTTLVPDRSALQRAQRTLGPAIEADAADASADIQMARELLTLYSGDDDAVLLSGFAENGEAEADDADLLVPDWLLAAVELQQAETSQSDVPGADNDAPDDEQEADLF